jgi:hypothetical protein
MGAGEWIALAGLVTSCLAAGAGVAYRLGQVMAEVREVIRRVDRIEGKLDRVPKRRPPEHVS